MLLAIAFTVAAQMAVVYLPIGQRIFATAPMTGGELALSFGLALLVLIVVELWKLLARHAPRVGPPQSANPLIPSRMME
jgi:Ca2+-transporting ATPase